MAQPSGARRYLVTGGAGFVGSHMVATLRDRGDDVVVLDNLNTGHRAAVPPDVPFIQADLADAARMIEAGEKGTKQVQFQPRQEQAIVSN